MRSQVGNKFREFFEKWMSELEENVRVLREKCEDYDDEEGNCKALVNKLTQLHKDYYSAKWAAAHEDVLVFFDPIWLTPLENASSWMTGWKPSTMFRVLDSLKKKAVTPVIMLSDLADQQLRQIESLKVKIRVEEDKVEREMERQQVSMADRKIVELTKRKVVVVAVGPIRKSPDNVELMEDAAVKGLIGGLETVVKRADCVRLKTLKGILDALNPRQCVKFLAALGMLQIEMRKIGKRRETVNVNQINPEQIYMASSSLIS